MKLKQALNRRNLQFPITTTAKPRLLIAEDDTVLARALSEYFTSQGFACRVSYTVDTTKEILEFWQPSYLIVELMLPHSNGLSLLKFINAKPQIVRPRVIVTSKTGVTSGLDSIKRAGASGFLIKPFKFDDIHALIDPRWRLANAQPIPAPLPEPPVTRLKEPSDPATKAMIQELHLVNLFLKQAMDQRQPSENLFNLMRMVSLKVKALRCSFIQCTSRESGLVLASNDDPSVRGLPINLRNYPEVQEVMRTMRALLIPNVRSSELMNPVRTLLLEANFETLAVFPIFLHGRFFGVTSVRMAERDPGEMYYIDRFGQVAAQIIALSVPAAIKAPPKAG